MTILNISDLDGTRIYNEFLRVPALSMGLYAHKAGEEAPQNPHTEDEVYYVIAGSGVIAVDGADHPVSGGTVVYVPADVPHQFHSVVEDLRVLVFVAPAEGTVQRSD